MGMKRLASYLVVAILLLGVLSSFAGGMSFNPNGVNYTWGSVDASFQLVGYGPQDVKVTMTVTGDDLNAMCTNKGIHNAPGQNPVDLYSVTVADSSALQSGKNGALFGNLNSAWSIDAAAAGCPNGKNWTVTGVSGTIIVTLFAEELNGPDTATAVYNCDVDFNTEYLSCRLDHMS